MIDPATPMDVIETTGTDLSFFTGVMELPNGEQWVSIVIHSGAVTFQVVMPPKDALETVTRLPEMILQAVDAIYQKENSNGSQD